MKSRDRANQSASDMAMFSAIADLFAEDVGLNFKEFGTCAVGGTVHRGEGIDLIEAIEAFPRYITPACLSKFLARVEIFRNRVLPVHGNIVECGVLHGGSLFTWAKLSAIFEPVNHTRRIVGFDTFSGFEQFHDKDAGTPFKPGDLRGLSYERMQAAVDVFNLNRPLAHIPKIELVKGDLAKTAGEYVTANQSLVVAMLNLDVDLYAPTIAALEAFVPRMPKGAVIIFDEVNYPRFVGESIAMREYFKLNNLRLQRLPWTSITSFAVIE
jgi:hypothetical protein